MTVTVTELGDEQLVDAVRAGDESAFGILFERYRESLVRYVARMVPGGPDQAEDVIQDVFASALTSLRSSDRPIVFKPWIYRIAKNACIDRHRKTSRYTSVSLDTAELGVRDEGKLSTPSSTPESVIDNRETIDSLRKAFSGLEDSHHEILVLREFEGKSYDKIGDRMGLSPAAVQSALFRARRRLQSEYEEIATGRRCETIQSTLDEGATRNGGVRKRRKVLVHMHDCDACRRHAAQLGLTELIADSSHVRTLRARAAALLPLPLAHKFATGAVAAVLLVGGGYAVESQVIEPARDRQVDAIVDISPAATRALQEAAAATQGSQRSTRNGSNDARGNAKRGDGKNGAGTAPTGQSGSGGPSSDNASGDSSSPRSGSGSGPGSNGSGTLGGSLPDAQVPDAPSAGQVLDDVHSGVDSIGQTVGNSGLPGGQRVGGTVDQVNSDLQQVTSKTGETVDKTVGGLTGGLK